MAGRPPSNQTSCIEVQEYKFDGDDENEKSLARYLLQAPTGTVRTRMKGLLLDGFKAHRMSLGRPLVLETESTSTPRRKTELLKFYFDRSIPLERACYDHLRKAQAGKRKTRAAKLLRLGYDFRKTAQATKAN